MNALDSVISYFAPGMGLRRARSRVASRLLRGYEGASKGNRTSGWKTSSASANGALDGSLVALRNRSRDLTRNNPYAAAALRVIVNNTVGTGIIPQAQAGKRGNRAKSVMDLWASWGETTECDVAGRRNFYSLQALVMRAVAESGECFVRRYYRKADSGLTLHMQVQVLEADYIDVAKDSFTSDADKSFTAFGIKYDRHGAVLGYWMHTQHPGDRMFRTGTESALVPAKDVRHIYREDRPGQSRGVPWCAPVIIRLKDFDDYEDAQILRQKIASCHAGFITGDDSGSLAPGTTTEPVLSETIEPGTLTILPTGRQIEFSSPPAVDGYKDFSQISLRSIAVGYGVTYEAISADLSGVNFSSGRMGWLEFQRTIEDWRWHMLIPQLCDGVWAWFLEAAALAKGINTQGVTVAWTPPRREMINPVDETNATIKGIRAGLMTLPEAIRERGYDPETVMDEYRQSNQMIDDRNLILESDPRKTTQQGQFQGENDNDKGIADETSRAA